ncbi:MAG: hypothetical protein KDA54_09625 [Phycisphaerales bacterium]|nr:hypothetical protein [Phycisphaerales bacterium]
MPEIPRPNGSGPRTRADIDESSSSTPVTGEPLPQKAPPPGARSRKPGKLRLISLIVIPIVAAAAAAYFNPPQYGGGASLKIVEAGPPAASASNRKARYDVVEFTRSLFLSAAWSEAHHREEGPSLELVQTPRQPSKGQPTSSSDAIIEVVSTDRGAIRDFLAGLDRRFQGEYDAFKKRETERQESQTVFLQNQLREFSIVLGQLGAATTNGFVPPTLENESEWSVNDAFRRYWKRLQRSRARYTGQLMELVETQRQLDELLKTPPPATAIIDPADRAKAYAEHVVLTGDLKQLKDHLEDVRRAMRKVFTQAEQPLARILSALETIKECARGSETSMLSSDKRFALEKLAETAAELEGVASAFAREWYGGFKNLADQPIDPTKRDVLDFHDRIATKASDYSFKANQLLDKLKQQLRAFSEAGSDSAKGHFQTATLTREIYALVDAQARFAIAANTLRDPNEFLLDAALRSSRGLSQRASLIMKEIEDALETQARQRAFDERQEKIASLTKSAKALREATDEIAGTMIETLSKMQEGDNDTNSYLDHVFELETTSAKREFVQQQIDRINVQLKQIKDNPVEAQFPESVAVEASVVSKRPKNLVGLISAILAAWGTSFVGVLGISRLGRRQ